MGDVALAVPVVQAALEQNKDIKVTILIRKAFIPLFKGLDVEFIVPDLYGKHKGFYGLFLLHKELKSIQKWDSILDFHDALRSKILRTFFKLSGTPVFHIDKGRKEKKVLTSKKKKGLVQLKHTTERYADVLRSAGIEADLSKVNPIKKGFSLPDQLLDDLDSKMSSWIGIAPFAQHVQKMYPIEKMHEVINHLVAKGYQVFIFGGGEIEKEKADDLCKEQKNVTNLIGKYSLEVELGLLSQMDLVLSMDSANMHMASLTGTKVVSIWGATHPLAGFTPFGQDNDDQMIQISTKELPCRPCSVFGNKPCYRSDFACMNWIEPNIVVEKIEFFLEN
jgi:ADP-heptose:LPS heptosyltransferase